MCKACFTAQLSVREPPEPQSGVLMVRPGESAAGGVGRQRAAAQVSNSPSFRPQTPATRKPRRDTGPSPTRYGINRYRPRFNTPVLVTKDSLLLHGIRDNGSVSNSSPYDPAILRCLTWRTGVSWSRSWLRRGRGRQGSSGPFVRPDGEPAVAGPSGARLPGAPAVPAEPPAWREPPLWSARSGFAVTPLVERESAPRGDLLRCPGVRDPAVVEGDNGVSSADGGGAVRNHQEGALA
ncbi:hypothetical protein YWIDRAFT_03314 [Streptomyces sp. SceaMP-e96]|nr:hypothetical protein YWIDRAFT_03314 [Streptomyces sp. SceaMP-e96]